MLILKTEKHIIHAEHEGCEFIRVRFKKYLFWIAIVHGMPVICSKNRNGVIEKEYHNALTRETA